MVDRPPPQRYRIVERGGRLEVIDLETGGPPASAAERMAAHDAAHGNAALKFDRAEEKRERAAAAAAAPPAPASPATGNIPVDPIRAKLEAKAGPWQGKGEAKAPQKKPSAPAPAAATRGPKGSQTFVTGKWWDNKGPRTVTLGEKGRKSLTNGMLGMLIAGFFMAMAMLLWEPLLLLVAGFALFRFSGTFIGPIGARLIDEAIKVDGRPG